MTLLLRVLRALGRFIYAVVRAALNAVYKTVTRAALYVATGYLALYFTLNSGLFKDRLMGLLGDILPGHFQTATLQWGPAPWRVTLLDTEIRDPAGTPVIQVRRVTVHVDLSAMWAYAVKSTVVSGVGFDLRFTRTEVDGADVLVEVTDDGWVGLAAPFSDPTSPPTPPGAGAYVLVEGIQLTDSRCRVDVPRVWVDGRGLDVLGRVVIDRGRVRVDSTRIASSDGVVIVQGAGPGGRPLRIPWQGFDSHETVWDHGLLVIGDAELVASRARTQVRGRLDTRGRVRVDATADAELLHHDPLIRAWVGDSVVVDGQLTVTAEGPFSWPDLVATLRATRLEAAGLTVGPIDLGITMVRDPWRRTLEVSPLSLDLGADGIVHLDRIRLQVGDTGDLEQRLLVDARLDSVLPESLWDLGLLPSSVGVPAPLEGELNGALRLDAARRLKPVEGTWWEVDALVELSGTWDGDDSVPIGTDWAVMGRVGAQLGAGADTVLVDELHVRSGGDTAHLDGRYDLDGGLDLALDARLDVGALLEAWGVAGFVAQAEVAAAHVTGTTRSPDVSGLLLSIAELQTPYGLTLRAVSTLAELQGGQLRLRRLGATTDWGRLKTDAQLGLWTGDVSQISESLPLDLTDFSIKGVQLRRLNVADLAGEANLRSRRFRLRLGEPALGLSGNLALESTDLQVGGETFSSFLVELTADARYFEVERLIARMGTKTQLSGSAKFDRVSGHLTADVTASGVQLGALDVIRRSDIDVRGAIGLKAHAAGRLCRVRPPFGCDLNPSFALHGKVDVSGLGYGQYTLGSATIKFNRPLGSRRVSLTSTDFFEHMRLHEAGLVLGPRMYPERLVLTADVSDLDVVELVPSLRGTVDQLHVDAATVHVDAPFGGQRGQALTVSVQAPDGALTLTAAGTGVRNDGGLIAGLHGSEVRIARLVAEALGQRVALCGEIDLSSSAIAIDLATGIDLGEFELASYLNDLRGRLITVGTSGAEEAAPYQGSCLAAVMVAGVPARVGSPKGFLAVRNTLKLPVVTGGVEVAGVRAGIRALGGKEITLEKGVIHLGASGGGPGTMEVRINERSPLQCKYEEGSFRLHGRGRLPNTAARTTLASWSPNKGELSLSGEDIFHAVPREWDITLDPDVTLVFDHLSDDQEPALELRGSVTVVEGVYKKSFSLFAQAIGSVLGRSVDAYSQTLTEAVPWLKELELRLRVEGANLAVRSDADVFKIDVETALKLDVTGTLSAPEVQGHVEVVDGSFVYNVVRREFEVTRGMITLDGPADHPILDIEAETVVERSTNSSQRFRTDDEDYVITMGVKGRYPDIQLEFDSKPTLPVIDIQYLILTGRTKQDLEQGGFQTTSTLDLFSANLANLVTDLIKAPFVESLDVKPLTDGTAALDARFVLRRNIRFGVSARQGSGTTTYDARYTHKISDRLELEALRRGAGENAQDRERYEVRLKYTVPID